jgi:hypothetical protein
LNILLYSRSLRTKFKVLINITITPKIGIGLEIEF